MAALTIPLEVGGTGLTTRNGLRPLLWRGDDWPDSVDRGEWQDGAAVLSARDLSRGRYYGPVIMPPRLAALFKKRTLGVG